MNNLESNPNPLPKIILSFGLTIVLGLSLLVLFFPQSYSAQAQEPPTPTPAKWVDQPVTTSPLSDVFHILSPEELAEFNKLMEASAVATSPVAINPIANWFSNDSDASESIAWGDMDGDGDLDLAVGNSSAPSKVYLNEGGILQATAVWESRDVDSTYSLAWGDVDNDGDLDLVVGNGLGGNNKIYFNNGDMLQTSAAWVSGDNHSTYGVALGDIDGDSDLDLVAGNYFYPNVIYYNDGNGGFFSGSINCTGFTTWQWGAPVAGPPGANSGSSLWGTNLFGNYSDNLNDWISTPDIDLSAYAGQTFDVSWFEWLDVEDFYDNVYVEVSKDGGKNWELGYTNTNTNTTWTQQNVNLDSSYAVNNFRLRFRLESDSIINQTGYYIDDVSINASVAGNVYFQNFEGNDGGFGPHLPPNVACFGGFNITKDIALGDADKDGDLDIAVANDQDPNEIYQNDSGGLQFTLIWTDSLTESTQSIAWGDMNGDGYLDLATGNYYDSNKVYLSFGGVLQTSPGWTDVITDGTRSLAWGDVDGDGDLDLAVGNREDDIGAPNKIYLNDGGILDSSNVWEASDSDVTHSIALGDADGDGDLDLAVGNWFTTNKLHPNEGGGMQEANPFSPGDFDYAFNAAWGDMDNDGDLDLAVSNWNFLNKVYLNQNGTLDSGYAWNDGLFDPTFGLAWGDVNGDGLLDLATGNYSGINKLFLNLGATLDTTPAWTDAVTDTTWAVAFGDIDNDGDLDLAVANESHANKIYLNNNGSLSTSPAQMFGADDETTDLAWGDVDGDGDLDLAVVNFGQPNRLYLNEGGNLQAIWNSEESDYNQSLAWGDVDGDGDLDLAVGIGGYPSGGPTKVYYNEGGILNTTASWQSQDTETTLSVAWVDADGDGDLDLAAANRDAPNKIYFNHGGALQTVAGWQSDDSDHTRRLAWGDVDGDGDMDAASANLGGQENTLYLNGKPAPAPYTGTTAFVGIGLHSDAVATFNNQSTTALAPANYYAVPGRRQSGLIPINYTLNQPPGQPIHEVQGYYSLDGGDNWLPALATSDTITDSFIPNIISTHVYTWDVFKSGFFGQSDNVVFRLVALPDLSPQPDGAAGPYQWPYVSAQTYPFRVRGNQVRVYSQTINIGNEAEGALVYRLPQGQVAGGTAFSRDNGQAFRTDSQGFLRGRGYMNPGDRLLALFPATQTTCTIHYSDDVPKTIPNNNATAIRSYLNVGQSGIVQDVNVAVISGTHTWFSDLDFNLTSPAGTNIQLMSPSCGADDNFNIGFDDEAAPGAWPCPPTDGNSYQPSQPLSSFDGEDSAGLWELTINDSFFLDGGELQQWGLEICATEGNLFYTNGTPTINGLNAYTVTNLGVQNLVVSQQNPLMLFNVNVSLEWDAHTDSTYLDQLAFDLKRASAYLYDFSDGQVALGDVTVSQNADNWVSSHVIVRASNAIRPFAAQGGIVLTATVDPQHSEIVYDVGQVSMGATWNRYGNPGQSLGQDWPLILAHELSHYLLFLDDTYLGLDDDGLLISVDTCTGSAMGDVYVPANTEFIFDPVHWADEINGCGKTLSNKSLNRTEWETLDLWYPPLVAPVSLNEGPTLMPYEFTQVSILDPVTPTNALEDPTFYLDYQNNAASTSEARAFLLHSADNNPADFEYMVDLGNPTGGQNRVKARGAGPGDRLCVFDPPHHQYACEVISDGDDRLAMAWDDSWTPLIQLTPVSSKTFKLAIDTLPTGLSLQARLYPEYGYGSSVLNLTETGGIYSGTFNLPAPALAGQVQVWVNEGAVPRREAIVSYSVGGNPGFSRGGGGFSRGGGGFSRGGGGFSRGGGGFSRGGGAPLLSPDGQMTFFTENPIVFEEGDFYTIQNMSSLPTLPAGQKAIGQGYNLVATQGAPVISNAAVSYQYLGNDVLLAEIDEADLKIHFWNGDNWTALETTVNEYFNLASAPSQGVGIYALLGGVTTPQVSDLSPKIATNDVTTTLTISGSNFLAPVSIRLQGNNVYTLSAHTISANAVQVYVPAGLPAQEFEVFIINGGGQTVSAPHTFGLFEPYSACFYDFFESGANKWTRTGQWDVVTLTGGGSAITDSPDGNYDSAPPATSSLTTQITSMPFDLSGCNQPLLVLKHDYRLAKVGSSIDRAKVEVSNDGGTNWTELQAYTGGGIYGAYILKTPTLSSEEWLSPTWKTAELGLSAYTGTVQLRLSMEVDEEAADKGWLIDEVLVVEGQNRSADLGLTISHGSGLAFAGTSTPFTLTGQNIGPDTVDAIARGLFSSGIATVTQGSAVCGGDTSIACGFDDLSSSDTSTVWVRLSPHYSGWFTVSAEISGTYPYFTELNPLNNQSEVVIQIVQPTGVIYLPLVMK